MAENQQAVQKNGFVKTTAFKVILIILLEVVSLLLVKVLAFQDGKLWIGNGAIIYWLVCAVLSISSLNVINKNVKDYQRKHPGIVYPDQSKTGRKIQQFFERLFIMLIYAIILSPIAAPIQLGNIIHNQICKSK